MATKLKTCRFCTKTNFDHDHAAARSAWIKYGPRHSAHLACILKARGVALFADLPTHRLAGLPLFEIRDLKLETEFRAEIYRRVAALESEIGILENLADVSDPPAVTLQFMRLRGQVAALGIFPWVQSAAGLRVIEGGRS